MFHKKILTSFMKSYNVVRQLVVSEIATINWTKTRDIMLDVLRNTIVRM